MQMAMNNATVVGIPTINHVKFLTCPDPPAHISPTTTCTYAMKYDAYIKVPSGNELVTQTCNALMQFSQKIKSVDALAVIPGKQRIVDNAFLLSLNWRTYLDCSPMCKSMLISYIFNLMASSYPFLASMKLGLKYLQILVGGFAQPIKAFGRDPYNLGETICLGWLLYSANKYDKDTLCHEIWQSSLLQSNFALLMMAHTECMKTNRSPRTNRKCPIVIVATPNPQLKMIPLRCYKLR